jgi:crotonobetainyl-CoA:carnitine CoA-transferase CaiB-like acyl-CoA transferase
VPGPLHGIRVIDLTTTVLGPFASQILGDMGAEVWKVEPPSGDTLRGVGPARSPKMGAFFLNLNRNKRSVVLDLKSEGGRKALRRMLKCADVFFYANRPQAMARLGFPYDDVASVNPRIIYCGAFGYGQRGPYNDRPAYDDLIQGASGLASVQSDAARVPHYAGVTLADRVVGMAAASAIGMALYRREKSGVGQAIEIPMFETMVEFVMGDHLYGATFDPALGSTTYPRILHRRPYQTKDGYISVLPYTDGHWRTFFQTAGRTDILDDPRFATITGRTESVDILYALLGEILMQRTTNEWISALVDAGVPVAPVHTPESVLADPHLQAVGYFRAMEHPTEGPIKVLDVPSSWSESRPEIVRAAPRLGEHTLEVLRECECTEAEIATAMAASS